MRTGVALDENFNMVIANGSFWPEPSSPTESRLIVGSNPGSFRWAPEVGCNLQNMLLDDADSDAVEAVIEEQHELDGLRVTQISPTAEGLLVEFTEIP